MPLSAFPGLVPTFAAEWHLSNTEAGWISGVYYLGYMLVVPFLMSATDRVDAKRVFLAGAAISAATAFGFAWSADGFWSAFVWRALAGVGLAGTYMPGLKALTDRNATVNQSRGVVLYTGSYSVGVGVSFLVAGSVADALGWRAAFVAVGIGPLLAGALVLLALTPKPPASRRNMRELLDFRPVFRNRAALGYIFAYGAHCYELMAMRAWIVAFAGYAVARSADVSSLVTPTGIATAVTLIGMPASIIGNEGSIRFGRRRTVLTVMIVSIGVALAVGAAAAAPLWLVVALIALHAVTIAGDSGSITAGTVGAATPEAQGATMAVHSTIGFGTSFLGPLVIGVALDHAGGSASASGWLAAYAVMALGTMLGPLALWLCRERRAA
ncbi:MAG TPA: MFS transporter [Candidatus Cybelea sp.]|nr:MFS transporter [Candidatus Cybelea sp.]